MVCFVDSRLLSSAQRWLTYISVSAHVCLWRIETVDNTGVLVLRALCSPSPRFGWFGAERAQLMGTHDHISGHLAK